MIPLPREFLSTRVRINEYTLVSQFFLQHSQAKTWGCTTTVPNVMAKCMVCPTGVTHTQQSFYWIIHQSKNICTDTQWWQTYVAIAEMCSVFVRLIAGTNMQSGNKTPMHLMKKTFCISDGVCHDWVCYDLVIWYLLCCTQVAWSSPKHEIHNSRHYWAECEFKQSKILSPHVLQITHSHSVPFSLSSRLHLMLNWTLVCQNLWHQPHC